MGAIYYNNGVIRPIIAVIKSLASALSIGAGAPVGREGPIIQISAALGSTLAQMIRMAPWQRITLVAAGAGAGIAATFNTPIGGVMFAIELMMPELSARTFLPVALATGTATFIGRIYFGIHPAFAIPTEFLTSQHPATLDALILFALLGALIGLAATAFVRGLTLAEELFEHIQNLRHVVGMLALGILIYVLLPHCRPLLRRRRGLFDDPGRSYRRPHAAVAIDPIVRRKTVRDLDQPRIGIVGRHFLAVAVHGRHDRRRIRRSPDSRASCGRRDHHDLRNRRHGRHGRRRHRCRHARSP